MQIQKILNFSKMKQIIQIHQILNFSKMKQIIQFKIDQDSNSENPKIQIQN